MFKRVVLILFVTLVVGNLTGKSVITRRVADCLPCTHYCKTHPNAPQCN